MIKEIIINVSTNKVGSQCSWPTGYSEEEWAELTEDERNKEVEDCVRNMVKCWESVV